MFQGMKYKGLPYTSSFPIPEFKTKERKKGSGLLYKKILEKERLETNR